MVFRWQAASKLANRLGLLSTSPVKKQPQRRHRSSPIANSIRKVSSHLHRHRHSESLMTSYLRMQAAAGEPELAGGDGQPERQGERQDERQPQGQKNGQLMLQGDGQADRHDGRADRMMGGAHRAVPCPDVDVQSLQVSSYSCTGKAQPCSVTWPCVCSSATEQ